MVNMIKVKDRIRCHDSIEIVVATKVAAAAAVATVAAIFYIEHLLKFSQKRYDIDVLVAMFIDPIIII